MHRLRMAQETLARCEVIPRRTGRWRGHTRVSEMKEPEFAGCIARTPQERPVCDDAAAQTGAGGEENQVTEIGAVAPDAEPKFGQCTRVAVVLDVDREIRIVVLQRGLERHVVPGRKVRWVEQ